MFSPARTIATAFTLAALLCAAGAQTARDLAVELTATVNEAAPSITLNWARAYAGTFPVLSQTVFRRAKDAPRWTALTAPGALAANVSTFTDTNVSAGVSYEYYLAQRLNGGAGIASGYLSSGIRVAPVVDRGRVLLLVDDTMTTPLATELATFIRDLQGDGWTVVRTDIARNTATVPGVRSVIQSLHAAEPTRTVAVILFGRIPVSLFGRFRDRWTLLRSLRRVAHGCLLRRPEWRVDRHVRQ